MINDYKYIFRFYANQQNACKPDHNLFLQFSFFHSENSGYSSPFKEKLYVFANNFFKKSKIAFEIFQVKFKYHL
jgi:hypothetical protein